MQTDTAWSVRGVDEATRESVIEAARQSGVSVGEWLRLVTADKGAFLAAVADSDPAAPPPQGMDEAAIARLDRRMADMEHASLQAFEALKKQLERSSALTDTPANAAKPPSTVPEMVAALARELDNPDEDARSEVEGKREHRNHTSASPSPRSVTPSVGAGRANQGTDEVALREVSQRVKELLASADAPRPVERIDNALRGLERRIEAARSRSNPGTAAKSRPDNATALANIEARVAELSRQLPPVDPPAGAAPPAVDPLSEAIDQIAQRQRMLDGSGPGEGRANHMGASTTTSGVTPRDVATTAEQIRQLGNTELGRKKAYAALARQVDTLATEAPLRRAELESLRSDLRSMEDVLIQDAHLDRGRLDALGEEISSLREALGERHDPAAIARIEGQVANVARMVEAVAASASAPARDLQVDRLETRVEDLGRHIEALVTESTSPAALDELKIEIAAIRQDIADRPAPDTGLLEEQIRGLASRVDQVISPDFDARSLGQLENQVSRIAADLEHTELSSATLDRLEDNLASMQSNLTDNEVQSIEAAKAAAAQVVRELSSASETDGGDAALIRDLRQDLEDLRLNAGESGREAQTTLGSINQTITQIVQRLTELEAQDKAGEDEPSATPGPVVTRAAVQPPEAAASAETKAGEPADFAADEPLALAMPASGDESATDQTKDSRARRADFIAAARRAAQAAATESREAESLSTSSDAQDQDSAGGPFQRIAKAIHGRKKSILLAAAAIVIALGAMQIYGDIDERGKSSLIAKTEATDERGPFRNPTIATPVAPMPGIAGPALIAPSAETKESVAFAPPGSVKDRFIKQPPGVTASSFKRADAYADATQANPDGLTGIGTPDLVSAARAGDPSATYEIANRYANGIGIERDMVQARIWYARSAEAGLASAQYQIANLFERGVGGGKDLARAVDWYQRSADRGNINAMHNLAVLMSEGADGPPDHAKALQWFNAAANYGVKDSQYNLGVLFARGIGPEQDLVASYKWFAVAAAGDGDAAQRRDEVADMLSAPDLVRARALAQAWSKKPAIADANSVPGEWSDASLIGAVDQQALVQKIQTLLAASGFDPGPRDGLAGPKTREAVMAFQRQNGIATTGKIDKTLVAMLTSRPN